jgi:hypothetical protein
MTTEDQRQECVNLIAHQISQSSKWRLVQAKRFPDDDKNIRAAERLTELAAIATELPDDVWPIKIGKINVDLLQQLRDQLWAEAVVLYDARVPWWLTKKEAQADAERNQRDRYVGDPWDRAIADYVETASEVTMDEVLRFAVHLEIGRCGQSEMNRAARCLRSLGLSRVQVRTGDKRVYKYRKPVTEEGQTENVTPLKLVTVNDR